MDRFLVRANQMFVEALTYGDLTGHTRPLLLRLYGRGSHEHKVKLLNARIEAHRDDGELKEAYQHKLQLVESVVDLLKTPQEMLAILADTQQAIQEIDEQLSSGPAASNGAYLCSSSFGLADLAWGILLYRYQQIGLAPTLWGEIPRVDAYARRLFNRPAFVGAAVQWDAMFTKVLSPTRMQSPSSLTRT